MIEQDVTRLKNLCIALPLAAFKIIYGKKKLANMCLYTAFKGNEIDQYSGVLENPMKTAGNTAVAPQECGQ